MGDDTRKGLQAALGTYAFWGFVPIYFVWLNHIAPTTIIAHRVIWAALMLLVFLLIRDRGNLLSNLRLTSRQAGGLILSGTLVAINWLIFVYAISRQEILSASLGYFINPLVNIVLGMLFLKETLRGGQWLAVALAAAGTCYLAVFVGEPPWIALGLAFSFGFYGLVRKKLDIGPMKGLFWETLFLSLPGLVYLSVVSSGETMDDRTLWLLIGSGLVTILPLIGFNYAAKRLDLSVIGFVQYLSPTISFILAIFVYHEPFSVQKLVAFGLIWLSLIIFTITTWRRQRAVSAGTVARAAAGPPNALR